MKNIYGIQQQRKGRSKKASNPIVKADSRLRNTSKSNSYMVQTKEQRCFTTSQRKEIYKNSKGICQMCGKKVSFRKFHADHIIPWAKNGSTSITNGQCLCAKCNLKKSDKYTDDRSFTKYI